MFDDIDQKEILSSKTSQNKNYENKIIDKGNAQLRIWELCLHIQKIYAHLTNIHIDTIRCNIFCQNKQQWKYKKYVNKKQSRFLAQIG